MLNQFVYRAVKGHTMLRLENPIAPSVERASTAKKLDRLLKQAVKVVRKARRRATLDEVLIVRSVPEVHTAIGLDNLTALNVKKASSISTLPDRLLKQAAKAVHKASGRTILGVPLIVRSVTKVRTTTKRLKQSVRSVLLENITWERKRLLRTIVYCVEWARTTTLQVLVKHATDVQKPLLKVRQVAMRVFQASTKLQRASIV
tara:strand:+ start:333 stop:941 length:609 start_codon:yes stop_codon:yes gene_type:complete